MMPELTRRRDPNVPQKPRACRSTANKSVPAIPLRACSNAPSWLSWRVRKLPLSMRKANLERSLGLPWMVELVVAIVGTECIPDVGGRHPARLGMMIPRGSHRHGPRRFRRLRLDRPGRLAGDGCHRGIGPYLVTLSHVLHHGAFIRTGSHSCRGMLASANPLGDPCAIPLKPT